MHFPTFNLCLFTLTILRVWKVECGVLILQLKIQFSLLSMSFRHNACGSVLGGKLIIKINPKYARLTVWELGCWQAFDNFSYFAASPIIKIRLKLDRGEQNLVQKSAGENCRRGTFVPSLNTTTTYLRGEALTEILTDVAGFSSFWDKEHSQKFAEITKSIQH